MKVRLERPVGRREYWLRRTRARVVRETKRASLELARGRHGGEFFVDYGWIKLIYSGDSDEQEILYHLNQARWYEKDMNVFRSLVAPGQTVIDVGANLGFVTTMLASIVGIHGRVLAFEPSKTVFGKLLRTIALNGLTQVVPFNTGCGASRCSAQLHRVTASSGNSSILGDGPSTRIRIERLDEMPVVWETRTAFLKIDTEGYEPEVLEGASRLIAEHRPIIYLEMGGDYLQSTLQSIELLTQAGYSTDHVRGIDWSAVGNGSDFFFLPSENTR